MTSNLNLSKSNINRFGVTAVPEQGGIVSLQAYPNPTTGKFIVDIENIKNPMSGAVIVIYNVYGEQVLNIRASGTGFQLDISNQPAGLYFLKMKTEQGSIVTKIMKQ